jgi:hypothetical protein
MVWALKQRIVTEPTARHVLLCLANYANESGQAAFPSIQTLMDDTGLSRRTITAKLGQMVAIDVARLGNQDIARAWIKRADMRPVVYDLNMTDENERGAARAPRSPDGVQDVHPVDGNGVQLTQERGAARAPDPLRANPLDQKQKQERPRAEKRALAVPDRFAEFWSAYPVKKGKAAALKAWRKIKPEQIDGILAALAIQARDDDDWKRGFCPHASTYLNGARWEDEVAKPKPQQASRTMGTLQLLQNMKEGRT